mmetsp:Transcript_30712/g.60467  ORF Transcript_30712/g.60467 Transcript_30712/m.60467 type:complete len:104 (+) Transcript_30712:318-629(+)
MENAKQSTKKNALYSVHTIQHKIISSKMHTYMNETDKSPQAAGPALPPPPPASESCDQAGEFFLPSSLPRHASKDICLSVRMVHSRPERPYRLARFYLLSEDH